MKYIKRITLLSAIFLSGCAVMHHTQVGEVDSEVVLKGQRFEVLVSQVGVNIQEAANLAKAVTANKKTRGQIKEVQDAIALFQMGPRTGNPIYDLEFTDKIVKLVELKCPNGKISGLTSVREMAKYPVVSGEIVKIIGYCQKI